MFVTQSLLRTGGCATAFAFSNASYHYVAFHLSTSDILLVIDLVNLFAPQAGRFGKSFLAAALNGADPMVWLVLAECAAAKKRTQTRKGSGSIPCCCKSPNYV